MPVRIGHGYDVHRLVKSRKLILGGVEIPYEMGLDGHSDADVVTHALIDSFLGAAALGDIGCHFPDTDPKYKDADSMKLLENVMSKLTDNGYSIGNVDITIVAEKPKLSEYIGQMRANISKAIDSPVENISIKATTNEKLGFIGKGEGIAAFSVALLTG